MEKNIVVRYKLNTYTQLLKHFLTLNAVQACCLCLKVDIEKDSTIFIILKVSTYLSVPREK